MRHLQRLDYEQLREAAAQAVEAVEQPQYQVADELGVSKGALSKALGNSGPKYAKLQARVVDHLTRYAVHEVGGFEVQRKPSDS